LAIAITFRALSVKRSNITRAFPRKNMLYGNL
jgi:hypothetical protein